MLTPLWAPEWGSKARASNWSSMSTPMRRTSIPATVAAMAGVADMAAADMAAAAVTAGIGYRAGGDVASSSDPASTGLFRATVEVGTTPIRRFAGAVPGLSE